MRYGIRTLDEVSVSGKTVLCRIDINQPVDRKTGTLKSISRIRACVPTLQELSAAVGGALEDCQSQLDLDMGTAVRATVFFTELLRAGDGRVDTGVTLVPPEEAGEK